jgi:hypothetical protein
MRRFAEVTLKLLENGSVSKKSRLLREGAARELRKSRNDPSPRTKGESVKRAAAYKALADNEAWLQGEKSPVNPKSFKRR